MLAGSLLCFVMHIVIGADFFSAMEGARDGGSNGRLDTFLHGNMYNIARTIAFTKWREVDGREIKMARSAKKIRKPSWIQKIRKLSWIQRYENLLDNQR